MQESRRWEQQCRHKKHPWTGLKATQTKQYTPGRRNGNEEKEEDEVANDDDKDNDIDGDTDAEAIGDGDDGDDDDDDDDDELMTKLWGWWWASLHHATFGGMNSHPPWSVWIVFFSLSLSISLSLSLSFAFCWCTRILLRISLTGELSRNQGKPWINHSKCCSTNRKPKAPEYVSLCFFHVQHQLFGHGNFLLNS